MNVEVFNLVISSLTVLGQFIIIVLLALLIISKVFKKKFKILDFVSTYSIHLILVIAWICVLSSLYYSEIVGYEPCKLCWFQRIFIYPQAVLTVIALYLKDNKVVNYTLWLAIFAFTIAGYHYLGQFGITTLDCGLVGYSSSCSERFVMNFGYITIPLMALTAMGMNIMFALIKIYNKK